jgi:hypothetical protein
MALGTHNLSSGRLRKDFDETDETKFRGVDWPSELIFWIPVIEKSDLDIVA